MMVKKTYIRTTNNNNKLFVRNIFFFFGKKSAYFIVSEWLARGGVVGGETDYPLDIWCLHMARVCFLCKKTLSGAEGEKIR